ncbi:response regulator [Streptomyces sp. NPDC056491]|uniref:response regulator n=1 Tax=Streptomyces sp. NPDC056491 TaxID=3345837 RepID=UPI00369E2CCE
MTEVTDPPVRRLLLVEDDAVIRDTVRIALEPYGFATSVAADGLTGLELFREQRPGLLILDVMLPELDEVGLCRRFRETSTVPNLPGGEGGPACRVLFAAELVRVRARAGDWREAGTAVSALIDAVPAIGPVRALRTMGRAARLVEQGPRVPRATRDAARHLALAVRDTGVGDDAAADAR